MSATKAGKRPLRTLTAHEKLNAIKRVSVGGESKASVARDIGVPESTLRGWCKNQEKISYQVRTSPTNLDETPENVILPAKRVKLDEQPYNLCMKTSEASNGSFSPNSENHFDGEYPKSSETDSENSPLNLRTKPDTTSAQISPPKSTNNHASAIEKEKEREKNRAELARLSAELGLNRPEVFLSTLNNSNNMNDVTSLLIQWNSIYQQHLLYQQQKSLQHTSKNKITAPADTSTKMSSSNGLLTTVDKRDKVLPNTEQQPSVYDSVSYWLRQQSLLGLNSTSTQQPMLNLSSCLPSTSSMTHGTTTTTAATNNTALLNGMTATQTVNQLRFWNWYKQSAYNASQMQAVAPQQQPLLSPQQSTQQPHLSPNQPDKQILYQQLTKETTEKDVNSENEVTTEDKPKNGNKNRSVLDNLLLNNNTIEYEGHKEVEPLDAHEAIEHGEKFLHWLESCSDPSVTTMQILTLQTLIKNLKTGFDRKNGDCQSKAKVKRK